MLKILFKGIAIDNNTVNISIDEINKTLKDIIYLLLSKAYKVCLVKQSAAMPIPI